MFEILDEIVQKQRRYDATSRRHDEKVGADRATAVHDAQSAKIALDQMVEEVISEAGLDAARYNQAAAEIRGRINGIVERHNNRLANELYVARANEETAHQQDVARQDAEMGEGSDARAGLVTAENTTAEALAAVRARVTPKRRPLRVHWRTTYLPLMLVIALLEMPLNQLSFLLFFRGAPIFSWLLALAVGATLVVFAHLAGVWTRQLNLDKRGPVAGFFAVVRVLAIVSGAIAVIYIISGLRQRYVNFTNAPDPGLADGVLASQSVLDQVTQAVAQAATNTALGTVGWFVFGLNIAFFAVGLLLAFRRHDPDPDYERAVHEHEVAAASLRRHKERYTAQKAKLDDRFATETEYLNREITDAEGRLDESQTSLETLNNRRLPDLTVVAQCARVRAEHRVNSFYARAANRRLTLGAYQIPDIASVLATLEGQSATREQPASGSFQATPFASTVRRPPRPSGPGGDRPEPPTETLQ